jgi:membrane-associated phospholipid phosphatase
MLKKILPPFSYVFHPLFISVYAVVLYFFFGKHNYNYQEVYLVIIQIVIITIFIPLTVYYLLLSLGKVDSIMLAHKNQRRLPLLIHAILLLILIRKSITIDYFPVLYFYFLASFISTFVAFLFLFSKFKVSLHQLAIASFTVFAVGISLHFNVRMIWIIVPLILCNGLIASSRLVMKAHTPTELILGGLIGSLPQIGVLYFWL